MQTITRIAIHAEGENPVFGEGVIRVCLSDEAAGMFITFDNPDATSPLKIDVYQFKEITKAVEFLLSQDGAKE